MNEQTTRQLSLRRTLLFSLVAAVLAAALAVSGLVKAGMRGIRRLCHH